VDLIHPKKSGFSLWQYMRIDELQSSTVVSRLGRCGWLVFSGAQCRDLRCRLSMRGERREMKWRKREHYAIFIFFNKLFFSFFSLIYLYFFIMSNICYHFISADMALTEFVKFFNGI
jgi:hypothetical protein